MTRTHDQKSRDLADHFLEDYGTATEADRADLAQQIQDVIEDWLANFEQAQARRCTCRMSSVNSATIDPPEPILDPWCPIHSNRDPDYERDLDIEDRRLFPDLRDDEF